MKRVCVFAGLLLISTLVAAQGPPEFSKTKLNLPKATITVAVNGLTCQTTAGTGAFNVHSWSWGVVNSTTAFTATGGAGAGKATISDLNIQKSFDACSPALLNAVVTGKHFNTLTLTQSDAEGNAVALVTLNELVVSAWTIGGDSGNANPVESVSFNFAKVCVTDVASGNKACFDAAQNKGI